MGNTFGIGPTLRPELECFLRLEPSTSRAIMRRFERAQRGFGWGLDFNGFLNVMRLHNNDSARSQFNIWDDDRNGVADVLELSATIALVCRNNFDAKAKCESSYRSAAEALAWTPS